MKKVKRKEVCGRKREKWKRHKERKERGKVWLIISPSHCLKIDKMIKVFSKIYLYPKVIISFLNIHNIAAITQFYIYFSHCKNDSPARV